MSFFNSRTVWAFTGLLSSFATGSPVVARDVTTANAEAAFNTLQQWYNQSTGLWIPSTGWWNSANCLTVVANLAAVDGNIKNTAEDVFRNTYTQAQQYNLQMAKTIGAKDVTEGCEKWMMHSYYTDHGDWPTGLAVTNKQSGFLNDYYDDEGWWALGWIAAYDITGNQEYLQEAESIFVDMQAVFGKTNCSSNGGGSGGIWWDRPKTYVNAIANELHLSVAAHLANRVASGNYRDIALQQWNWFLGTGMINSDNLINDGLNGNCQNNGGTVWSYNQGVILGGLSELSRATGDASYITKAQSIADAAIASLAPDGILKEVCEPDCGRDGPQFKGIFARNLMLLQQTSPQPRYARFLEDNANSIWNNDRNGNNELGIVWGGPFRATNAAAHSSAMDALVGSLAT